jgi:hypothetical protein
VIDVCRVEAPSGLGDVAQRPGGEPFDACRTLAIKEFECVWNASEAGDVPPVDRCPETRIDDCIFCQHDGGSDSEMRCQHRQPVAVVQWQ